MPITLVTKLKIMENLYIFWTYVLPNRHLIAANIVKFKQLKYKHAIINKCIIYFLPSSQEGIIGLGKIFEFPFSTDSHVLRIKDFKKTYFYKKFVSLSVSLSLYKCMWHKFCGRNIYYFYFSRNMNEMRKDYLSEKCALQLTFEHLKSILL